MTFTITSCLYEDFCKKSNVATFAFLGISIIAKKYQELSLKFEKAVYLSENELETILIMQRKQKNEELLALLGEKLNTYITKELNARYSDLTRTSINILNDLISQIIETEESDQYIQTQSKKHLINFLSNQLLDDKDNRQEELDKHLNHLDETFSLYVNIYKHILNDKKRLEQLKLLATQDLPAISQENAEGTKNNRITTVLSRIGLPPVKSTIAKLTLCLFVANRTTLHLGHSVAKFFVSR